MAGQNGRTAMIRALVVAGLLGAMVTGCGTFVTVMENPETKDVQKCESRGIGLIPMSNAEEQHDECVKQLRSLGYEVAVPN
jgi:hypothetical protein